MLIIATIFDYEQETLVWRHLDNIRLGNLSDR